jgi:hypothetical protein
MQATLTVPAASRKPWGSYALQGFVTLFMLMDAVMHTLNPEFVQAASRQLGYPTHIWPIIGVIELVIIALYVYPRTAVLGAILFTGYFGGAVSIHVRIGDPLLSHTLSPIYAALIIWGSLYLRDEKLRALLPFSRS